MSNDRLTDEQVAEYTEPDVHSPARSLAREVQEYRALRPDCPTCEGSGRGKHPHLIVDPADIDANGHLIPYPCPDCTDGKMPLDRWVALLVETLAVARSDMEGWAAYASDYFTAKHNLAGDLASVDAVLKMVPK